MTFPRNSEDDALESDDADKAASPSEPRAAGSLVSHERIGRVISFPRERSVLDYFQTLVQSQPEAVAIKDGVRLMTYTELDLLPFMLGRPIICRTVVGITGRAGPITFTGWRPTIDRKSTRLNSSH